MKKMISVPQPQDVSNELPETFDHQLRDKKLQKLWKKAQFGGFSGTCNSNSFLARFLKINLILQKNWSELY